MNYFDKFFIHLAISGPYKSNLEIDNSDNSYDNKDNDDKDNDYNEKIKIKSIFEMNDK